MGPKGIILHNNSYCCSGQQLLKINSALGKLLYLTYRWEGTGRKAGSINSTSSAPLSEIGLARLLDSDICPTNYLQ
jgi:hypothetical protein